MADRLNLLTVTGERPDAFAICQKWMQRQTYEGRVEWIIVDDGRVESNMIYQPPPDWSVVFARPEQKWQPGMNTQAANLRAGLELIGDGPVVIIEDDDWYSPDWLAACAAGLKSADLFGECFAIYYNVASRVRLDISNANHASLCATAMKGAAIDALREQVERAPKFIDLKLWNEFNGTKALRNPRLEKRRHVVGIKGMPGRANIGIGHELKGRSDPDGVLLREIIGEDAAEYLE
jgi:hypothetical protein